MANHSDHVCPVWMGRFLANPLRKLIQDPKKMLSPYIQSEMTVLDVGCAMGYFSIPMAKMVGHGGKVLCVDLQEDMLKALKEKAKKIGVEKTLEMHLASKTQLELDNYQGKVDFALTFFMVHEVPDPQNLFSEIYKSLKPGGVLLVAEPKFHVSKDELEDSIKISEKEGFQVAERPSIFGSWSVLLRK